MQGFLSISAWDGGGLALAHALRAPWLDALFGAVTWLGSLMVLLPLALLAWWRWRGERSASFVALALVFASRLYLQVHFPSDIIAGAMLATLWVVLLRRMPAWRESTQ